MGLYTTLLSNAKSFDVTPADGVADAVARKVEEYQRKQGDLALPSAFAVRNSVYTIEHNTNIDGGTYTLTVTLRNGVTYTTAAIAFDANAATIQAALDTASPASVTDAHVVVTGGDIATADIVLTFSGATVDGERHFVTIDGAELLDDVTPVANPAVEETAVGQTDREPWAILKALDVITDAAPPVQGLATPAPTPGVNALNVPPWFIRAMALEASVQDHNPDVESLINVAVLGYNRG